MERPLMLRAARPARSGGARGTGVGDAPFGRGVLMRTALAVARCAAATLLLWRVLDTRVLLGGMLAGILAGGVTGWVLSRSRVPWAIRIIVGAGLAWTAAAVTTGSWRGLLAVPHAMTTFLTVGLPAAGLEGLAAVSCLVALPATAVAVWGAHAGRSAAFIGGPVAAMLAASVLAVPRQLPLLPLLLACVLLATMLLVDADDHDDHLTPLVPGTASPTGRRAGAAVGLTAAATVLGLLAALSPALTTVDLRHAVHPKVHHRADDNPLANAARLQVEPDDPAAQVDVTVTVAGPSPGRLRLAVLDAYTPEGWHQSAGYSITGRTLAPGPIPWHMSQPAASPAVSSTLLSDITVIDGPASAGLGAVPTAGDPVHVRRPGDMLYSTEAGVLTGRDHTPAVVSYRTVGAATGASADASPTAVAARVPSSLYGCADNTVIKNAASAFAAGSADPLQRLRGIESWLKLKRLYDPRSPGGQTIGSVEQFVGQDMSRGNMEAFVTTFAVLARCAGVPVRVVVGYPAPAADTVTPYRAADVTAWVEVPLDRRGWVAIDPVPSPEEQQRQMELAQQPPPPPGTTTPPPQPVRPPIDVDSTRPASSTGVWIWLAVAVGVALLAALLWTGLTPAMLRRRRRRTAQPADAVLAAWDQVGDGLADRGVPLRAHLTPTETAHAAGGHVSARVGSLTGRLATLTDLARYDRETVTGAQASEAWAIADAVAAHLPTPAHARVGPLRHPARWVHRYRAATARPGGGQPWRGTLVDDTPVNPAELAHAIPGVQVGDRLGEGGTATVYRGHLLDDGRPVAVKVFHHAVDHTLLHRQRFEWEARVAGMVSGHVNLPVLYASGVTATGRPYLVSKLYGRGTLTGRIQRGGPLTPGDVVSLGQSLCLALDTLHRNSILHGDIKPDNVFIDDDGTPVLGDLGSAWLRAEGGPATAMTPPYAAPEVWLGQHPTKLSDIYSLGLTLLFAATGRNPIVGVPPAVEELSAAFGTDIYLALLEVDPRRRPRTARDAARMLGADVDDPSLAWRTTVVLPTPSLRTPDPSRPDQTGPTAPLTW